MPNTVAYSAAVVGKAPTHIEELVERRRKEEEEKAAVAVQARASASTMARSGTTASSPSSPLVRESSGISSSNNGDEKTMRLSFRAVPALHFVKVEEGEREKVEAAGGDVGDKGMKQKF